VVIDAAVTTPDLVLALAAVAIVACAALLLLPFIIMDLRARRDFAAARGTQHRHQVERAVGSVRARVQALRSDAGRLDRRLAELERDESQELNKALARFLVSERLDEVPGIGPTRVAAILASVFRSKLSDLHSAHLAPGIGPQTQAAISAWVTYMEARWPELRGAPFTGKQQIPDRYAATRADLTAQRSALARRIAALEVLERRAAEALALLSRVTAADFRRALRRRGRAKDQDALRQHVLGLFPPWAKTPDWYVDLLNAGEGDEAGARPA
jgi:hypothetical protein